MRLTITSHTTTLREKGVPLSSSPDSLNNPAEESEAVVGDDNASFEGEIVVSSRIIDQLSSGLYESPAACLKELINNSFDADATEVIMSVRPDAEVIIIHDNGVGITHEAFKRHFERIAESWKREDGETTGLGRPKIGRIGIGFIAANEICDRMDIVSTIAGSSQILEVSINFRKMRLDPAVRRRDRADMAKGDYTGRITEGADPDEHYTIVYLRDVRGLAQEILSGAEKGRRDNSLFGLKPSSVRDRLASPRLTSWDEFDTYSRAMLEIALNVPVRYHDGWLPRSYAREAAIFSKRAADLKFEVALDGSSLRKPIVLNSGPDGKSLFHVFHLQGQYVNATGYLYAASGKLAPRDLNGALIRIRNAAVGKYDSSFLGSPSWINTLFRTWTTCEIYADDSLESAMNIDRRSFRVTDPSYAELRTLFHAELRSFLAEVREQLYHQRSIQRNREKAEKQSQQLEELRDRLSPNIGEKAASDVVDRLRRPPTRPTPESSTTTPGANAGTTAPAENEELLDVRALNVRFTPVQVLEIVAAAAGEINLDPAKTRELLSEISRRLRG